MTRLGPYELNQVYTGDARELAPAIPDGSVDLVFTDPPYKREYLPLYGWLAQESARVLKPDGFLVTYVGMYWKDECMALVRPHMSYFADMIMENFGKSPILWHRRLISRHKSLMVYCQRDHAPIPRVNVLTLWRGTGRDKRFHVWGQNASEARYYIDCFSAPGDLVIDFFVGGGTTAAMATTLGRRWLAFEIDSAVADIARRRLGNVQQLMQPFYEQAALL